MAVVGGHLQARVADRLHHDVQRRPVLQGMCDVGVPKRMRAHRLPVDAGRLGGLLYDAVDGAPGEGPALAAPEDRILGAAPALGPLGLAELKQGLPRGFGYDDRPLHLALAPDGDLPAGRGEVWPAVEVLPPKARQLGAPNAARVEEAEEGPVAHRILRLANAYKERVDFAVGEEAFV